MTPKSRKNGLFERARTPSWRVRDFPNYGVPNPSDASSSESLGGGRIVPRYPARVLLDERVELSGLRHLIIPDWWWLLHIATRDQLRVVARVEAAHALREVVLAHDDSNTIAPDEHTFLPVILAPWEAANRHGGDGDV